MAASPETARGGASTCEMLPPCHLLKSHVYHAAIHAMDNGSADLNLLLALDALLSERNVTRAAKRLNLSQPALSARLARLRALFGDELFTPTSRGVLPTAAAEELREPLRRVLDEVRGVLNRGRGFDAASADFTFVVASSDFVQVGVLLPFLLTLSRDAPNVRVMARLDGGSARRAAIERGEIDLAFVLPEEANGLRSATVLRETYVGIARAGRAPEDAMPMARFTSERHIIVSPSGDGFSGPTDKALAAIGLSRRVSLAVSSFTTLIEAVAGSDLIALAPERLARRHLERLDLFAPPVHVPGFEIAMAWNDRTHGHPAHCWLRDRLSTFCEAI